MRLFKLHGLGNDFLVLLDDGSTGPVEAGQARALCERRTGVGADGFIRSERAGDGAFSFELANADGSPAEMSGNGARCLGLAAARAGWWEDRSAPLILRTPAGERRLDWQGGDLEEAELRVGLGPVRPYKAPFDRGMPLLTDGDVGGGGGVGWMVDVGNPHAVGLLEGEMPPLEELEAVLGPVRSGTSEGDCNYEFVVRGPEVGALTMVVHERGVGWTQACGTGSVAAAWAAHQQGWVGKLVTVHNPGGTVEVDLSGPEARLTGRATFVATVEVDHLALARHGNGVRP
ncbi:MAG: diaminopimelate epimerase [Acidimicrobiales bacterium]